MRLLVVSLAAGVLLLAPCVDVAARSDEECVDETCVVAEFTGSLGFDMMCDRVDPTGSTCGFPVVLEAFSDPRLDDEVSLTGWSRYIGDTSVLWLGSWLIGDSDAGWVEVTSPRLQRVDGSPTQYTSVLVGVGAYEGLSAVSEVTVSGPVFEFDGRIVPGSMGPGGTDFSGVIKSGSLAGLDW